MKQLKPVFLILMILAPIAASKSLAIEMDISDEATEEVRVVAAKEKLSKEENAVVLYARGLCCPSCSIGVRKLVSRLDFVDRRRFNKGVDLDTKTQLVTVAIGEEKVADFKALSVAIFDAGYDPVRSYRLEDGNLLTEPLASDS